MSGDTTPALYRLTVDPTRCASGTPQRRPAGAIVSRADARRLGFSTYLTGRVCAAGHAAPRYVVNCACTECNAEAIRNRPALDAARKAESERLEAVAAEHGKRLLSRDEARRIGSTTYFTARPCRGSGHIDFRYTASGICASCAREAQRLIRVRKSNR